MTTPAPTLSPTALPNQAPFTFTAFDGARRFASGPLAEVAVAVKQRIDDPSDSDVLVFDDRNGRVVDFDLRGTADDVLRRLPTLEAFLFPDPAKTQAVPPEEAAKPKKQTAKPKKRSPGRPKLGVVGREVTLLPRHWEWLNRQPGGASVTLRKLVETARLSSRGEEAQRQSRDGAYRFMAAMAGNLSGFEEASRAFFAGDRQTFLARTDHWPEDVRAYTLQLAAAWLAEAEHDGEHDGERDGGGRA